MKNFLIITLILLISALGIMIATEVNEDDNTSYQYQNTYNQVTRNQTSSNTLNTSTQTITQATTPTQAPTQAPTQTTSVVEEPKGPVMGNKGTYTERYYEWVSHDGAYTFWITLNISDDVYTYCTELDRVYDYSKADYYYDLEEDQTAKYVVDALRQIQDKFGLSDCYMTREAVYFVQSVITYQLDIEGKGVNDYPKFPAETLMEGRGDCEDTSILMASILREMGYGSGIVVIPEHCAALLYCNDDVSGTYYPIDGKKYVIIESTAKRNIGDVESRFEWDSVNSISIF